ncbi:MAG: hypothetical protein AB7F31_01865 [Parachlamydiales bacterium]
MSDSKLAPLPKGHYASPFAARIHQGKKALLLPYSFKGTYGQVPLPLDVEIQSKIGSGRVIPFSDTHYFCLAQNEVSLRPFASELSDFPKVKVGRDDATFPLESGHVVIASRDTVRLWAMEGKAARQAAEWKIPQKYQTGFSFWISAAKAGEVVALVQETKGRSPSLTSPYQIFYLHPNQGEPCWVHECTNPLLSASGETFRRLSSGWKVDPKGGKFHFVERSVGPFQPPEIGFPPELTTDLAPIGPAAFHTSFAGLQIVVEMEVSIVGENGRFLVVSYGQKERLFQPGYSQCLIYDKSKGGEPLKVDPEFAGKIRLLTDGSLAVWKGPSCGFWSGGPKFDSHWTLSPAEFGEGVENFEILDLDGQKGEGFALVRFLQSRGEQRRIYPLAKEETTPASLSSLLPLVVEDTGPPPLPPPEPKGKVALVLLAAIVITYCAIRLWQRHSGGAPPAPPGKIPRKG